MTVLHVSAYAVDWFLRDADWWHVATIPVFTAVIGWLINWTGLMMLFAPVRFHGRRVPGMRQLASVLPRKLQEVPGLLQGGVGWQGIIPSRAAKMGSIAVDKVIAKLGTAGDFYRRLQPDQLAAHIVAAFRPEVPRIVDEVMEREHPGLWHDLPQPVREAVHARVQAQLPTVVGRVTEQIGTHIDQLLDPKLMVIDQFEADPALVVRVYQDVGRRELRTMVNVGLVFGFLLGIPVALVDHWFGIWWLLPLMGVAVGWITNALGMWLIYEPPEPRRLGPFTVQGLFPRRQQEAAEVYARIIAGDVITMEHIADFLLGGPRSDRTRQLLVDALEPVIDQAVGVLRGPVRVAVGRGRYDAIRHAVAAVAVERTAEPLRDAAFSRQQSERIRTMVAERTKELPPRDFVEMMRSATREDEWMLYAHGAVMGLVGGLLHLWLFGIG
jgi:uncharacterized membrane protein YheB (UPF0754 family)